MPYKVIIWNVTIIPVTVPRRPANGATTEIILTAPIPLSIEGLSAERPSIERGIGAVRIISVVAPLAGLLGTVTGMIVTFQMITLYGTGDPKLMAGGISQALVTTVLGLLVAIPTTLLHSFTASSAKGIIGVLEEQSTGILAERAETK